MEITSDAQKCAVQLTHSSQAQQVHIFSIISHDDPCLDFVAPFAHDNIGYHAREILYLIPVADEVK